MSFSISSCVLLAISFSESYCAGVPGPLARASALLIALALGSTLATFAASRHPGPSSATQRRRG